MLKRFLLALILAGTAAAAQQGASPDQMRARALELVNAARAAQGLATLTAGPALNSAASAHARDMLQRGFYAHVSPEGAGPRDRYLAEGGSKWELVAENIAKCTGCPIPPTLDRIEAFHTGWMNSPGHRANILRPGLTRFGFAVVAGDDTIYAVQTFAGPGTSQGAETGATNATGQIDPLETTARALEALNPARRAAGVPLLSASAALTASAANLLPQDLTGFALQNIGGLSGVQGNWRRLYSVAGACGGCGGQVVAGDVSDFVSRWLDAGNANRATLLDSNITQIGMTVRSDGQGRKIAVLLLGQAR
ncbi:CAP domain-containing protein [Pseudosulfitobacter koreensis]|uniref:CAP domain-containing protein n=1 Tax=Pseudosulfitobacter koreensis TaxID=2968472 RepID=A0ABT1Z0L3_9RHOB|nr:CAP domain-containing protein [Pseudosulfitobacter koreense]MCR8826680.1 CAP domain-containing protein [Pseudosulfitobacter koreense]